MECLREGNVGLCVSSQGAAAVQSVKVCAEFRRVWDKLFAWVAESWCTGRWQQVPVQALMLLLRSSVSVYVDLYIYIYIYINVYISIYMYVSPGCLLGVSGCLLVVSGDLLGASCVPPGDLLGASWLPPEDLLGASWASGSRSRP